MRWAKLRINVNDPIGTINPNIYGHFAEHFWGVAFAEGIWQVRIPLFPTLGASGMMLWRHSGRSSLLSFVGPVVVSPTTTTGRMGSGHVNSVRRGGQHPLGRGPRAHRLWHSGGSCDCAGWWAPSLTYIVGNVGSGTVRGTAFLTLTNSHATQAIDLDVELLAGATADGATARVLAGEIHAQGTPLMYQLRWCR